MMENQNNEKNTSKAGMYFGWFAKRFALLLYDILAVNFAYFLALVVRFYVHNEFRTVAVESYLPAYKQFSPWYTLICIFVFFVFRLYGSRWKHAGLHDLNRIMLANLVTAAAQVLGTVLFVMRMPITYYFIGAAIQFFAITLSRFSYKIYQLGITRLLRTRTGERVNTLIVGVGETGAILRGQIENDRNSTVHPVCLFAYNDTTPGNIQNGLPVIRETEDLNNALKKYRVQCVLLAEPLMPTEIKNQIRATAEAFGAKVADYTGYLRNDNAAVTPSKLLEHAKGPVIVVLNGVRTRYATANAAAEALLSTHYHLTGISADNNALVLTMTTEATVLNDIHEDWVKDTEQKTGQTISFF